MLTIDIDPTSSIAEQALTEGIDSRRVPYPGGHHVYIFTSETGPLYVGISQSLPDRWVYHQRRARWWADVTGVFVSPLIAERHMAETIERSLIRGLCPTANRRSAVATPREDSVFTSVIDAWNLHCFVRRRPS